jgi:hypothetical protein
MPGFTRGMDFFGPLAFIGLSQVRESAVFSGIPLVQRVRERTCGVWIVRIDTGETIGFLRFESGVQEIFAVQVLHGMQFPEMLEWHDERIAHSYVLPDEALAQVYLPSEEELIRSPAYHFQRGLDAYRKGELDHAIAAYRQCVSLDSTFPNAHYNLGVALSDAEQFEEAAKHLQVVIEAEPERAETYNSLGHIARQGKQPQQAIAYYEQAIALQPDYAQAHFNLGISLLQVGDYARGWHEYDWRWKTGEFMPFQCPHPRWDGDEILDKTLLIHTEQGAGDAIQFARFLPLAAQRCKKLILVCPPDLMALFATMSVIAEVRAAGAINVAEFDTYLPLMSLPQVLGTQLSTIPSNAPYFDVEMLRRRKGKDAFTPLATSSQRKVGIVWAGSPTYRNDRRRSCRLEDLMPILHMPGIEFYSLQKGERGRELADLPPGISIQEHEAALHDLSDRALLIAHLDLVIGVDTAVVHLAGALGKPVWTLLSFAPDWRWLLEGETTPWYPTMRLFRQTRPGDWEDVATRVAEALRQL